MSGRRSTTLFAFTLALASAPAAAQEDTGSTAKLTVSAGGAYIAGGVEQLQANLRAHLGLNSETHGVDLIANGFRLWSKPGGEGDYIRIGDDLFLNAIPFWYVGRRLYLVGQARYESSKSHKLDHRIEAAAGVGYAPVRKKVMLVRAALIGSFERAIYPGETFNIDVEHDGGVRDVGRVGVMSNGWVSLAESPVRLRYLGFANVDPTNTRDHRIRLDGSVDVKVFGPLSVRLAVVYSRDSVVLDGISPFDLRSTFGVAWSSGGG